MNQKIHVCPNCGAYVMSNDNVCPRCDAPLDAPVVDLPVNIQASDRFAHPTIEMSEVVAAPPAEEAPLLGAEIESVTITEEIPPELEGEPVIDDMPAEIDWDPATPLMSAEPEIQPGYENDETPPEVDAEPAIPVFSVEPELEAGRETPPEIDWDPVTPLMVAEPEIQAEREVEPEEPLDTSVPEEEPTPADATQPRLNDSHAHLYPAVDISEIPTGRYEQVDEVPVAMRTPARQPQPTYTIPPAPYTPPPLTVPPPAFIAPPPAFIPEPRPTYGVVPGMTYLQQRVQAYKYGGYRVQVHAPHEATLTRGKSIGAFGWLLALVSVIGLLWYLLILVLSGFQADHAYLMLEPDGRVYEDGPGAAHVRQQRSRTGRRWSIFGLIVFVFSLILAMILGVVGWIALDRYKPALREAYPEITLFEDRFSAETANPDDVAMVEDGAVVYSILAGITIIGLWGGLTLFVIGSIHAAAYRVRVPPLPGYA